MAHRLTEEERAIYAAQITSNPVWDLMKQELPQFYYNGFRASETMEDKERVALAHSIFDDVVAAIEAQAAMAADISEPTETGDGDGPE